MFNDICIQVILSTGQSGYAKHWWVTHAISLFKTIFLYKCLPSPIFKVFFLLFLFFFLSLFLSRVVALKITSPNKYNCSGPTAFKSQRVGYQSNQKLLPHYQHYNNQLYSNIHFQDTGFRVSWTKKRLPFLTRPTQKWLNQLSALLHLY